jgi:predicted nucleic acid-binding protein
MAQVTRLVVDASVALKWFVRERWSDQARALLGAYEKGHILLCAPYLLDFEVANVLRYKREFGAQDVQQALALLRALQLDLYSLDEVVAPEAIRLAYQHGLTMYDAAYLAGARVLGCSFWTADQEFLEKTAEVPQVYHIREWKERAPRGT